MARLVNGFIVRETVKATQGRSPTSQAVGRSYWVPGPDRWTNPVPLFEGSLSREIFEEAAEAVLGRWFPIISWLRMFKEFMDWAVVVRGSHWEDWCRTGSGENVGTTYWCGPLLEETKAQYEARRGKPIYTQGKWHLAEYDNVRETPGWPDWILFSVVAQKVNWNDITNPPSLDPQTATIIVPELGYGPDPGYKFPHFVDPVQLPVNTPVPEPEPPPYDSIPHRESHPSRVEQTERGPRRDAVTQPATDVNTPTYPGYPPWGSSVVNPADGRPGPSYGQDVLPGRPPRPVEQFPPTVSPPLPSWPPTLSPPPVTPPVTRPVAPPGPRERERKHKLQIGGVGATLVGAATESLDLVQVLWRSLPGKYNRTRKCKFKRLGFTKKAQMVWDHFDEIDMNKFVVEFIGNQLEDHVGGIVGRAKSRAAAKMGHGHGMEFGRSDLRRRLGDVDADLKRQFDALQKQERVSCKESNSVGEAANEYASRQWRGITGG